MKARERLNMFLYYLENGERVSKTCRAFSITRPTFYRLLRRFDPQNPTTLEDQSRRPHHVRNAPVSFETVAKILACHQQFPLLSDDAIATQVTTLSGVTVSAGVVQSVRNQLPVISDEQVIEKEHAVTAVEKTDHCFFCALKQVGVSGWKRALIALSVLTNIAVISMIATTLTLKSHTVAANLTHPDDSHLPETSSSSDHP